MAQLLAPETHKKEAQAERYRHDKLDIKDIKGTEVNTYGMKKIIAGRNYMDKSDIDKTRPN